MLHTVRGAGYVMQAPHDRLPHRLALALPIRWRLAITSRGADVRDPARVFALVIGLFAGRQVRAGLRRRPPRRRASRPPGPGPASSTTVGGDVRDRRPRRASSSWPPRRRRAHPGRRHAGRADCPTRARRDLGPPRRGHPRRRRVPRRLARRWTARSPTTPVAYLQYAKPRRARSTHTIKAMRMFLALGVLGGTLLALLAGLAVARRAMAPIAGLTAPPSEIAQTRDPERRLPKPARRRRGRRPGAHARARCSRRSTRRARETEAALARQREFVADASHELRTPLTSILANLELLEAELHGEDARDRRVRAALVAADAAAGRRPAAARARRRRPPGAARARRPVARSCARRPARRRRSPATTSSMVDADGAARSWRAPPTTCTGWC